MLDNSKIIASFCQEKDDGDTFIYTELLDRGAKKGNNGKRLVKTFYHRSREEFWEQWPTIQALCDLIKVRACTRVAPKSFEKVANQHLKMIVEAHVAKNFAGFKTLYNRACGITTPNHKFWLFDVDVVNDATLLFEKTLKEELGVHVATIPSKKGLHYITIPFDTRIITATWQKLGINKDGVDEISLHKDNPTNLYIPDGAD